mmetsp:Transcript_21933/g.32812  ORF Transcript_21933/g.32812 Transcript_21933/m.32812 type:complete len:271 (-) Transcript_21933:218-1030(-)|eukprot:CAMPEP_0194765408 /NCGR_PEP_ID=MMETSP0323_2-20130528/26462_1 /TAXON_ID=2866 ORGANISM="Crypthecodinium cohnii, Strain Seligo" /NCGR_SAMPLE_ID=MMETSP0323_2 /ASSEMBLY_ACC=CAM_ASM_000346 /LENGTH=270 /DNA_ID=CAMNT_0039694833 /DNA_START=31 /DNA_END=843 /DNA_ORIENTATION=-
MASNDCNSDVQVEQLWRDCSLLSDLDLAVALQGILSQRPAVQQALAKNWRASVQQQQQQSQLQPQPQSQPEQEQRQQQQQQQCQQQQPQSQPQQQQQSQRSAALAEGPHPEVAGSDAADETRSFRYIAQSFAAGAGAREVASDHVLAAAVQAFPAAANAVWGEAFVWQLLQLLARSGLASPPPALTQPPPPESAEASTLLDACQDLEIPPEIGPPPTSPRALAARMVAAAAAAASVLPAERELFVALEALPDASAATQLLEMTKIYVRHG